MSVTDVQRDIRRTRALRVAAFLAAALNAVMLAVNTPHGGLVALILAPFSAAAVIGCVVMIVRQTRLIGRQRRTLGTLALTDSLRPGLAGPPANARAMSVRENVLRRIARRPYHPPMTPEDYRRLAELETGLGWEPTEPPAELEVPAERCECGKCDGSHKGPAMRWFRDTRRWGPDQAWSRHPFVPACADCGAPRPMDAGPDCPGCMVPKTAPETVSAPMTGPGGRWRPVSELPEHDERAAEHFAALAPERPGRCRPAGWVGGATQADLSHMSEHFAAEAKAGRGPSYCPVCAGRDTGSGTVETMRQQLETERREQQWLEDERREQQ